VKGHNLYTNNAKGHNLYTNNAKGHNLYTNNEDIPAKHEKCQYTCGQCFFFNINTRPQPEWPNST
jgi:hypothetical protein